MSGFEVRLPGGTRSVESLDALEDLVRQQVVTARTPIRVGSGPWRPAETLPALQPHFDLWSAWEDVDEMDSQAIWRDFTSATDAPTPEPPPVESVIDPPTDPVAPVEVSPEQLDLVAEVPELPPDAADPLPPAPVVVDDLTPAPVPIDDLNPLPPRPASRGKVIDFPRKARSSQGSAVPAPRRPPAPLERFEPLKIHHDPSRDGAPPLARTDEELPGWFQRRHILMLALIGAGAVALGLLVLWVDGQAGYVQPNLPRLSELPALPDPLVAPEDPTVAADQGLEGVASELRDRIRPDTRSIASESQDPEVLKDVLFLELQRVVTVRRMAVNVITWSEAGIPEIVEIELSVAGSGDLSSDLGGAALVVGKYADAYEMDVRSLRVVVTEGEVVRERNLNADALAGLWRADVALMGFLLDQ
jgi:hypothetical protein